jgi:hypothetical protein
VRKSSGSETTFDQDLTEPDAIEAGVLAMADDVWAWCEKTGARADRDREDQVGRLPAGDPQPLARPRRLDPAGRCCTRRAWP